MPAEQPDDLDETFARIVADYDTWPNAGPDRGHDVPWPAQEDVDESVAAPSLAETIRLSEPDAPDDTAAWERSVEDEGHFVPPTPPPMPRPQPRTLMAWLGVLGAPIGFLFAAMTGWALPRLVTGVLIIGFVAGIVFLIATMSSAPRDGYDPDDGAVV